MRIKSKVTIPASSKRQQKPEKLDPREITTCPIKLEFKSELLPESLTDIMYALYKCGNEWQNPLELDLKCYTKGLKFTSKLDDVNALRALVFLGYVLQEKFCKPMGVSSCIKYKLAPKGVVAARKIAEMIGDTEIIRTSYDHSNEEVDCSACDGLGMTEEGNECDTCHGAGTVKPKRIRRTKTEIELDRKVNSLQRTQAIPKKSTGTVCPVCEGECILGNVPCPECDGTGEVHTEVNDRAIIRSTTITPSVRQPTIRVRRK